MALFRGALLHTSQETEFLDFQTRVKGIIPLWCAEAKPLRKKTPRKAKRSFASKYAYGIDTKGM